jgi:hypothetical protein
MTLATTLLIIGICFLLRLTELIPQTKMTAIKRQSFLNLFQGFEERVSTLGHVNEKKNIKAF